MKKKIFLFLIIGLFMISFSLAAIQFNKVSKTIWDFDNSKKVIDLGGKYPQIKIENTFGLGKDVWVGNLTKNTEECYSKCSMEQIIAITEPTELISDIRFLTLQEDDSWIEQPIRSYQFYVKIGEEDIIVNDYRQKCGEFNNTTFEYYGGCVAVLIGNHLETRPIWSKYNIGDIVEAGTYTIKLEGKKTPSKTIDWQIKTNGKWLNEWAIWGGSDLNSFVLRYYSLNETSGDVIDSKQILNGTNVGATPNVAGKIGTAYNGFGHIDLGDGNLDLTGNITISAWVYPTSTPSRGQHIIARDCGTTTTCTQYFLSRGGTGTYSFRIGNETSGYPPTVSTGSNGINEWFHIVGVLEDNNMSIYFNGVINNSFVWTGTQSTTIANTYIGDDENGGATFPGSIDEVVIFNKSLSGEQIEGLYNFGSGTTYPFSDGEIVLNSPENNNISTEHINIFNSTATITGEATLVNMSLWHNASGTFKLNETKVVSGITNETTFSKSFSDGIYLWNVQACDSDGDCGFAPLNFTIEIDTILPTITLTSPINSDYQEVGGIEYVNWTVSDSNLDSCWYDYNGTNQSVTCADNNASLNLIITDTNLTFYANDSAGNENSLFKQFNYTIFNNEESYSSLVVESSTQTFTINITYKSSDWNSITSKLNYNGTNYSGIQGGLGDLIIFNSSVSIPSITSEENRTFNWIFSLTNSTDTLQIESNYHNQTVTLIDFSICNSTQIIPFVNFSTYDADNPYPSINTSIKSSWDIYDSSGGGVLLNRSFEDITENNNSWAFCIEPSNTNYTYSVDIEIDSTTHSKNFHYIINTTSNNETTSNISLYLINDSEATLTEFEVVDNAQNPLSEVYISIQLYDIGTDTFYTIGMMKTSSEGKDLTYLNWYDTLYKFVLVQDGSTIYTTSPYKISETPQIFKVTTETTFDFLKFDDFEFSLTFNATSNNFILTFVKPSGDVEKGCLRVIKRNVTNDYTICDVCESSTSSTLYCNIANEGNGTFIADFYATGSFEWMWNIEEKIGNQIDLFLEIGNEDGTVMAIIFTGMIMMLFFVSPIAGVIGLLIGMVGTFALGFQPIDMRTFLGVTILGGLVIWALKK